MSSPIQIWTCAAFLPVYRCGGWATLRDSNGQLTGAAGGERNTTASRIALSGLLAALRDLPAVAPIDVHTTSPDVAKFAAFIHSLGTPRPIDTPADDLDLWAQIATASAGRRLIVIQAHHAPGTPIAFTTAWAELARDKAKATGPFSAAIPKANLAKVPGLALR
jgi:ribonuclease HI